ncbi:MAG: D-tagatose 3-epimerase [Candidatus Bathyarchaeota archaeon B26-2]|nr:MAG: D-tagatose 3-epimerase [Candidatus Bathyarchaeota archaeon B26-2]
MKTAICNEIFQGWDIEKTFRYVSELGYEGIEIAPFTISDNVKEIGAVERRKIREAASSYGLEVIGTHWLLVGPKGLHLTHPDERVRRSTRLYLRELVRFTGEIGGRVMVFGSPKQRNIINGVSPKDAWRYAVEAFRECSRLAEDYGVVVAIEPLPRRVTNFVNTAGEAIQLIKEVSQPNFRLHLDVYGMLDEGRPLDEIIRESRGYLAHFHINDDNGLGPGFGGVDYRPVVEALREIGYEGFLSVEVFDFSLGPKVLAARSLETLKRILG